MRSREGSVHERFERGSIPEQLSQYQTYDGALDFLRTGGNSGPDTIMSNLDATVINLSDMGSASTIAGWLYFILTERRSPKCRAQRTCEIFSRMLALGVQNAKATPALTWKDRIEFAVTAARGAQRNWDVEVYRVIADVLGLHVLLGVTPVLLWAVGDSYESSVTGITNRYAEAGNLRSLLLAATAEFTAGILYDVKCVCLNLEADSRERAVCVTFARKLFFHQLTQSGYNAAELIRTAIALHRDKEFSIYREVLEDIGSM